MKSRIFLCLLIATLITLTGCGGNNAASGMSDMDGGGRAATTDDLQGNGAYNDMNRGSANGGGSGASNGNGGSGSGMMNDIRNDMNDIREDVIDRVATDSAINN